MRPSVFVLTLGVMFFIVQSSSALKCYQCTEKDGDKGCDNQQSTDCPPDPPKPFVACATEVETSGGKTTIKKFCQHESQIEGCEKAQTDTFKCHTCNTDGCNKDMPGGKGHGNPLRSSIWMWPVTTLLSIGYLSYF